MRIIAITQARSGSTRFPKKILNKINGETLLEIHINRIKKSNLIDEIIIATTENDSDNIITEIATSLNVKFFRGSEHDVLDRFYKSIKSLKPDFIVRLTSDCSLIDGNLIDEIIEEALKKSLDYYSNILFPSYPDGQDIEVIKFSALEKAWKESNLTSDREHVTPFIKNNSTFFGKDFFTSENHQYKQDYNQVRMVVDYPEDLKVIELLIEYCGLNASWLEYVNCYLEESKISSYNIQIERNEGYSKSLNKD
jgi:spore coat polysaccharide biosynthesis protein SpsF (cytidylyltransferase family)